MPDKLAHYVKFARSLAMTSTLALQACGGSADPADETTPSNETTPTTTSTAATTTSSATATNTPGAGGAGGSAPAVVDAGSGSDPVDAGHISGPLPPPEMPRSLALA